MDTLFSIDRFERTPIYEQVVQKTERLIAAGILKPEDQLPSVRQLSEQLSVNPNTLQKAYTELERRGICYSVPGSGRFVSKSAPMCIKEQALHRLEELEELCKSIFSAGASLNSVMEAVKRAYGEGEEA